AAGALPESSLPDPRGVSRYRGLVRRLPARGSRGPPARAAGTGHGTVLAARPGGHAGGSPCPGRPCPTSRSGSGSPDGTPTGPDSDAGPGGTATARTPTGAARGSVGGLVETVDLAVRGGDRVRGFAGGAG